MFKLVNHVHVACFIIQWCRNVIDSQRLGLLSRVSSPFGVSLCCFSGVIAVVIFVSLAALAVMARFLYRRKETFQTQEPKAGKTDDSPETPFNTDPNSQSIISDNQKEYFIWRSLTSYRTNLVEPTDWNALSSLGTLTFTVHYGKPTERLGLLKRSNASLRFCPFCT